MYNKRVLAHYGFMYLLLVIDYRQLMLKSWSINVGKFRCATKRGKKKMRSSDEDSETAAR